VKQREYTPIEVFTLSGSLGLRLKGGLVERPGEGVAHWLASGLGILSKQVEKYSVGEFLERFFRFLRETRLKNILLVELDYNPVYKHKTNKNKDDLDDAIITARKYLSDRDQAENKVLVSALGKTKMDPMKDLHLTVEGNTTESMVSENQQSSYRSQEFPQSSSHEERKRPSTTKPAKQGWPEDLNDTRKLARFRKGCEKTFGIVLRDYAAHLEGVFDADTTEKQVSSWGSIP